MNTVEFSANNATYSDDTAHMPTLETQGSYSHKAMYFGVKDSLA